MRTHPVIRMAAAGHLALALSQGSMAASNPPPAGPPPRELNRQKAADCYTRDSKAHGSDTNFLVRPGLLADRASRQVTVYAESIHLDTGSPVEFALIDESSGKDYEAMAVSFAKPSAVHEALVFIGMRPGLGVDTARLRFWPKGERVKLDFCYEDTPPGAAKSPHLPVEHLVIDTRTGKPLPDSGFVFTGSAWVPPLERTASNRVYAADAFSPNSIVSLYNEPGTVLDVPRRAAQHEVYSYQVPNPATPLPAGRFTRVTFTPENKDGRPRVCDLLLGIEPGTPDGPGPSALRYLLREQGGPLATNTSREGLSQILAGLDRQERDAFATVVLSDDLPLSDVQAAASVLDTLDGSGALRIEPPPAGHPYYKCFLPDEKHRTREGRPVQPWELHIGQAEGTVTGALALVEEDWRGGDAKPTYHETWCAVPSSAALAKALRREDSPTVVLAFAPPDLHYGDLRAFMAPVLEKGMILYVFLPAATPTPTPLPAQP